MEDTVFQAGDIVQTVLRPDMIGMVVDSHDFGQQIDVRLMCTMEVEMFRSCELVHMAKVVAAEAASEIPEDEQENFTESNVIPFAKRPVAGSA